MTLKFVTFNFLLRLIMMLEVIINLYFPKICKFQCFKNSFQRGTAYGTSV